MSYNFSIGEYFLDESDNEAPVVLPKFMELPNAPMNPGPVPRFNRSNHFIGMSYVSFESLVDLTGLRLVLSNQNGYLGGRPGYIDITTEMVEKFDYALHKFKTDYPMAVRSNARLEWFLFWMRWSLENCDRPVLTNS